MKGRLIWTTISIFFILNSCNSDSELFRLIDSGYSGIDFANILTPTDSLNILKYEYFYNGASVSVGDFDNDGLSDLFFTGNMVSNKLYRNVGNLKFEDISKVSGIENVGVWNSGSAVADVNNDGFLDIYVCTNISKDSVGRSNFLFINQGLNKDGIPIFKDMAMEYGVEEQGHSQNAAFLDYDKDGDLDLYILTNYVSVRGPANYHPKVVDGSARNNDRLYRNNGDSTFTNVTNEAGIVYEGYGLGIAIADINLDGWPDIFIGNDYITNDLLYINNQDGTFSNKAKDYMKHQSKFSMGCDIADVNNDGLVDIFTLDMLPEINYRKKTASGGGTSYNTYVNNEKFGYEYQYIRNMMHINNGNAPFSEIGQMLGIYHTEWSWSPLFADVDNDGNKDLLITNGFPSDLTDMDYIGYRNDVGAFTKPEHLLMILPDLKLPNYSYKNKGNLIFEDKTQEWGLDIPSYANGAAFADLDNDGDLDYIMTNIDEKVFLYENTLYKNNIEKTDPNFIRIKLVNYPEKNGFGAKVIIHYGEDKMQFHDFSPFRGYLSTVENMIHFGLGDINMVDKLEVQWPNGVIHVLQNVKSNHVVEIDFENTDTRQNNNPNIVNESSAPIFREVTKELGISYIHEEIDQIDYYIQKTLPHKFSQAGPGIAVGDIDGDQLEDFIVSSSTLVHGSIFRQQQDGSFMEELLIKTLEKYNEDEGLLLFDYDGDEDLDLYIVSGGYEYLPGHDRNRDRLYSNDGNGNFTLTKDILPEVAASGSCVRATDVEGDGDLDLFIGGRVITAYYPFPPESFILKNENGRFINVTGEICNSLKEVGMVTDAIWSDYDNNGTQDLIVVGEFMAVTIFKNINGKLVKLEDTGITEYTGWWNSINGADIDKDGDTDYVLGNLGTNNQYHIAFDKPLRVYAKDFDNNGLIDPILSCYYKTDNGKMDEFPVHAWNKLSEQSPVFKNQFSKFSDYAATNMHQLLSPYDTTGMLVLKANYPFSSLMENLGNGRFKLHPLPKQAQYAPVNGMLVTDANNDDNLDIMLVGNDFGNEIISGRYDALNGLILLGNGQRQFTPLSTLESGFVVPGDAKALVKISNRKGDLYAASQNRDSLKIHQTIINTDERKLFLPEASDGWAELKYSNRKIQKIEFYYGSGYLSQSSRSITIPGDVAEIKVFKFNGSYRVLTFDNL